MPSSEPLTGCRCIGSDCRAIFTTERECLSAHRSCLVSVIDAREAVLRAGSTVERSAAIERLDDAVVAARAEAAEAPGAFVPVRRTH